MTSTRTAPWLVILAASLWGTTGTVAHFIGGAVSALLIGATTMGVGGLVLALIAHRTALAVWRDGASRRWLVAGALGVAVYPLAFYSGMDLAGVAVGNVIALGTGPLVGALLEWFIDKNPPGARWWIAIAVGLAGVVTLSLGDHSNTSAEPGSFGVGVLLALLAGVGYGVFSYAMGRLIDAGHTPLGTAGGVFGAGALPLLAVALWLSPELAGAGNALIGLGYLVAFPMVLSYVFYSRALRTLRSSTVLTIALVEPAVATVLAIGIVGERFDWVGALGLALIVTSVVLASRVTTVRNQPSST